MIYAESSIANSHLIQSNLQTSLDKLTVFNADHRIILSCTKSVRVLFERQKSKKLKPQDVSYNGQVIPASTSVKFLGITFDSALTFKSHHHTLANIARYRLLKMNSIFTSTYGPSTSTLICLYKSYIRSLYVLRCASYMRCLSPCTTYMGGGTNTLHAHAPCKTKVIRANEAPFMNKDLKKSIMTRSRLRNRYLKSPSVLNRNVYKSQRNLCTALLRKHKRDYFNNLDTKFISDNKKFWNAIRPLFSEKVKASQKISIINGIL